MNWWLTHNFENKRPFLEKRARIISSVRGFFDGQEFIEVQTPALQICPGMDAHIHAFKTNLLAADRSAEHQMYLHTSPELDMKKLLAAGMERIYQICPVYRNAEGSGLHSPEFTMLEWYRAGADYTAIMDDCVDILRKVAQSIGVQSYTYKGITCDPFKDAQKLSVCEAFEHYAEIKLSEYLGDRDVFAAQANRIGVRVIDSDSWEDIFHAVMAARIEPELGQGVPAILYDYPISMAALARKKASDPRFAERFELYVCGVELANAFSELTDSDEQHCRYKQEMALKQELYGETYPADEDFFAALEHMPESAGGALGVDRLVMLATGAEDIKNVVWAPVSTY